VYLLNLQKDILFTIVHFVTLHVIMEVTKMYNEALSEKYLLEELANPEAAPKDRSEFTQKESHRPCYFSIMKCLYYITRGFYVGVVFYFVPFTVVMCQWFCEMPVSKK
jgi:hypothetical protein